MGDHGNSIRASVISRSPSFLNRPNQAPMGPRTRVRSSHIPNGLASLSEGATSPGGLTSPGSTLRPLSPLSNAAGVTILKPPPFSTNPNPNPSLNAGAPGGPSITLTSPTHIPEFGGPPLNSADIVAQLDAITEGNGDSAQASPIEEEQEEASSPMSLAAPISAVAPSAPVELVLPLPPLPASPSSVASRPDEARWESPTRDESLMSQGSCEAPKDEEAETPVEMQAEDNREEDVTVRNPVVIEPRIQPLPPSPPPPVDPLTPPEPKERSLTPEEPISDEERREELDDFPAVRTPLPPPPSSHTARLTPEPQPPAPPSTGKILNATPPKLAPPHPLKFEAAPVQWKGLPLEAAVWTFDSKELQAIVSRAIRSSARESYIRLLAIDVLDNVLPEEVERLKQHKAVTQAKYRFLVHRRTMQLQALLSTALAPRGPKETEDSLLTATKLVVQISETTAECDKIMEELLKVTDQLGQIKRLLDHHWASALAIALRKLNGSYARRTLDLSTARERITQLEAELEDAWHTADKLAKEMDELDAAMSDEDEAIIETAEVVSLHPESRPMSPAIRQSPTSPTGARHLSFPLEAPQPPQQSPQKSQESQQQQPTPTPTDSRSNSQILTIKTTELPPISPLSPLLIKTAVPKRHSNLGNGQIEIPPADVPDSVSIKSSKSTKSYKSSSKDTTGYNSTRVSAVSAAKKRSLRMSQSSLRLPPGFASGPNSAGGHKRSGSRPRTPYTAEDQPPVPELPLRFASPARSSYGATHSSRPSSTLLHFDSGLDNPMMIPLSPNRRSMISRRTSFDSARVTAGHRTPLPWSGGVTVDDMYINPSSRGMGGSESESGSDEIEAVPRTPPPVPPKVMSTLGMGGEEVPPARPRPGKTKKGAGIPSMWMNVDGHTPKNPGTGPDGLLRSGSAVKGTTYQRLRGLTKRYSLPFPLFSRTNSSSQQSNATS